VAELKRSSSLDKGELARVSSEGSRRIRWSFGWAGWQNMEGTHRNQVVGREGWVT